MAALSMLCLGFRGGSGVELCRRAVLSAMLKGSIHVCTVVIGLERDSVGKALSSSAESRCCTTLSIIADCCDTTASMAAKLSVMVK